jgi:hypothetical protein
MGAVQGGRDAGEVENGGLTPKENGNTQPPDPAGHIHLVNAVWLAA